MTNTTRQLQQTDILAADDLVLPLLGLVGEVGSLAAEYKKRQRDQAGYRAFTDEVREELGDLLWYAAALARRCELSLDEILADNIRKTRERFIKPETPPPHPLFDEELSTAEQLPRILEVTFSESVDQARAIQSFKTVRMYRGGIAVGDPLDDNSDEDDEYRYHDAFHLAHMAVLGWSPVVRSLLRVKRSSHPDIDRIQDGGRAIAIEEGLSAYVFSAARGHSYFDSATSVPAEITKACRGMTAHLEVARRTAQDWEYAILAGYRAFNALTRHCGGTLRADVRRRALDFRPPSS